MSPRRAPRIPPNRTLVKAKGDLPLGVRTPWLGSRRALAVLLGCVALASQSRALAQVIEVRPDGATVTYAGPAIYSNAGVRPIVPLPPPPPVRASAQPSQPVAAAIAAASDRHQLSPRLIEAVAWRESRFDPNAVSPRGARGVMQLMPGAARLVGVDAGDPAANIDGGAAYLARMMRRFDGDLTLALAAYNAGPGAVTRYGGVPPFAETRAYIAAIFDRLAQAGPSENLAGIHP